MANGQWPMALVLNSRKGIKINKIVNRGKKNS